MRYNSEELYVEYRKRNPFGMLMCFLVLPLIAKEYNDIQEKDGEKVIAEHKAQALDMIDTSSVRFVDMFDEMIEYGFINK